MAVEPVVAGEPAVVVEPMRPRARCARCRTGPLRRLVLESSAPLCLPCAGLAHLVYLPRGDAALTRRAREASALWAVVVRHDRRRTRYERQGVLVEEAALARAEAACQAGAAARASRRARDAERRAAEDVRFTAVLEAEIRRLFPGCPAAVPPRSPRTPRCAAAGAWAVRRPGAPWTRALSRRRCGPPYGIGTLRTTRSSRAG